MKRPIEEVEAEIAAQHELAASIEAARAEASTTNLRTVDLTGFASREIEPQRYAVGTYAPYGHVALLGGHGGAGKSVLALTWAAHFAAGRNWSEIGIDHGRALYVSLEDGEPMMLGRLRRICEVCRLDPDAVARGLTIVDSGHGASALCTEVSYDGQRTIAATTTFAELEVLAAGHRFIVVDNASDAFDGNENDRRQVRGFIRMLANIAAANDAAVLLLAHVDKQAAKYGSAGNSYSGSTAWHNGPRSRMALTVDGDDVVLAHEKNNLGRLADPLRLRWHEAGVLVPTESTLAERADTDASDDLAIIAVVESATAQGVSVSTARTGPVTTWHALKTISPFPIWAAGPTGKARFWRSVNRLTADARLVSVEYRGPNRHPRTRFEVRQSGAKKCALLIPTPLARTGALAQANALDAPVCANSELARTDASAQPPSQTEPDLIERDGAW
ncbi:MAG: AAA family ATPase [Lysobacterales bacterium]